MVRASSTRFSSAANSGTTSLSNTSPNGSGRLRHQCRLRACDGYIPARHLRALPTLIPAPAAADSCVLPSISFLRNTLTCASFTMEPPLPAPFHRRAAKTAITRQFYLSRSSDLIVADQWVPRRVLHQDLHTACKSMRACSLPPVLVGFERMPLQCFGP